jgi:NAD(P)-dependent dehydrogenase (short-subunit alcohol dehydrogenase family)
MAQNVFITGASSGIGRATALRFQQAGWQVVATMRRPEKETELTQLKNVKVLPLDVTEVASVRKAVQQSIDAFGGIDAVINNAGYGLMGPFEAATQEQIDRQFTTNVYGVMNVVREVLPHFRERRQGVIVNNTSIGGRIALPTASLYVSSKFAVEGFSEALAYELRELGIQVKIVEPGAVATDFFGRSMDQAYNSALTDYNPTLEKVQAVFSSEEFMAGASQPEQIAEVMFTAATDGSDQLRYIAGEDAKAWWSQFRQHEEADFLNGVRQQFLGQPAAR